MKYIATGRFALLSGRGDSLARSGSPGQGDEIIR